MIDTVEQVREVIAKATVVDLAIPIRFSAKRKTVNTVEIVSHLAVAERTGSGKPIEVETGFTLTYPFTERYLLRYLLKAAIEGLTHELEEQFHYKGKRIFDPHE